MRNLEEELLTAFHTITHEQQIEVVAVLKGVAALIPKPRPTLVLVRKERARKEAQEAKKEAKKRAASVFDGPRLVPAPEAS